MFKLKFITLTSFLSLFLLTGSCTTINLSENEAFDIKRTIRPEKFENTPYKLEEISFVSGDSLRLNGWFIKNPDAIGTVLYFGGNGFVMVTSYHIIFSIIEQNVNLLVFDYRGYGENPGTPSVAGLKTDGLAACDYLLHERKIPPKELVLHGHSMGTFMATFVAGERSAAGLVLESPITDPKDWTGRLVPWLLKPLVNFDIDSVLLENNNMERIADLELPILMFAGTEDPVTPPGMAEELFKAARTGNKKLIIIEGGGHNDLPQKREYKRELEGFYRKIWKEGNS